MSDDATSRENTQDITEEEEEEEKIDPETTLAIRLDDEIIEVDSRHVSPEYVSEAGGRREYAIFPDSETAGKAAREHWEDMAYNDPHEFRAIIGDETLVMWALGQSAGPGNHHVSSLSEWLDLWLDTPEEHFASYDGEECDCEISLALAEELGWCVADVVDKLELEKEQIAKLPLFAPKRNPDLAWIPAVAYRSN